MLAVVGVTDLDELLAQVVPPAIRMAGPLPLPDPRSVSDVLGELRALADQNEVRTSLIGMGYYGTITPPVIPRNVLENPAWYTAYTPYQPEISQGRLEALLNFQTMVADLTGFELANASLARRGHRRGRGDDDGPTAVASRPATASSSTTTPIPQTIAVLATRAEPIGIELVVGDIDVLDRRLLRCAAQPARRRAARSPTGARRSTRSTLPAASPWWPPTCSPAC